MSPTDTQFSKNVPAAELAMSPARLKAHRVRQNTQRLDAIVPGRGALLAEDLEYAYEDVLRASYAPLDAFRLFGVDSRVPPGASSFKVRRMDEAGTARFHRGGSDYLPTPAIAQSETTYPVNPIVNGVRLDHFEELAAGQARVQLRAELQRVAEQAMLRFADEKVWTGDESVGALGLFNQPFLPRDTMAVPINGQSSPEAILAEMHRIANRTADATAGTFAPDTWIMSRGARDYLATRKLSTTTGDTILGAFLQNNSYISSIEVSQHMSSAAPGGADYGLLYARGNQNSASVVIPRGFTMLPVQEHTFQIVIPCYMLFGGLIMREPLSNTLVTMSR